MGRHRKEASGQPVRFAHPSEAAFARILDFYNITWQYEPRTFVLQRDSAGQIVEAFSPDFYLPEQDLYIEVTTQRQSLIAYKNRKIRRLREAYPEVRIKLLNRSDFSQLLTKYELDEIESEIIGQQALDHQAQRNSPASYEDAA